MIRAFTFFFCYQTTCYSYWLTECQTGTFWWTDRDAGTKPLKPELPAKTGRMVCLTIAKFLLSFKHTTCYIDDV